MPSPEPARFRAELQSAGRPETRSRRVAGTLDRLAEQSRDDRKTTGSAGADG
jgi:hypothetical protein